MKITMWIIRAIFFLVTTGAGLSLGNLIQQANEQGGPGAIEKFFFLTVSNQLFPYFLAAIFGIVALGIIIIDLAFSKKSISTLSSITFGLVVGFIIAILFGNILALLIPQESEILKNSIQFVLTIIFCFLGVSIILQTKDDFRFVIPYIEFKKETRGERPLVLDTSAIIDGRIADICQTHFFDGTIVVPRFVLQEIHSIADSSTKLKRNRGRRGLDILNKLQQNEKIKVEFSDAKYPNIEQVDNKLIKLAKDLNGRIVTTDYNLNKIAQLQAVDVINIHELANSLKTMVLPGETITVKVIKEGEESEQGVGYLEDGTMIVVERGRRHIGREVQLLVTSVLQTNAGRLVFGKIEETKNDFSKRT